MSVSEQLLNFYMNDSTGCDKVEKCQVTLTASINMAGSPLIFPVILLAHLPS